MIFQAEYPAYDLVYNSQDDEFLVAWQEPYNTSGYIQKVQRLTTNGASVGSSVSITTNMDSSIRLGYSSTSNRYIALFGRYIDANRRYDMIGRPLNLDLSFAGSEVDLTPINGDQLYVNVEYMPSSDTYLFTWWDGRDHYDSVSGRGFGDLRAKRISTLGVQIGPETVVYSPPTGASMRVNSNSTTYNIDIDQALMLNGTDEAGDFISTFVSGDISKSKGLPIVRDVWDVDSAAISGVDQPTWLAVWNSRGDIYVRIIFPRKELFEGSVVNDCGGEDCQNNAQSSTNGHFAGPINTRTGGLYYQTEDISVSTVARELNFFRTYSSLSTDLYSMTMGYGWTSNLDTHLVFPSDPGGQTNTVLFKMRTANQYPFFINSSGSFRPGYGVAGSLVFSNNQYTLTMPDQSVYIFNSVGKLQTWHDAEGHLWTYIYNANDQLEEVSADNGTRSLTLGYDNQGRIASVTDHANRVINYMYNSNGDLVSASSLGGGTWQYEYDSTHHLTRVIDPMGDTDEHTEYDTQGRAIRQWDGEGNLVGELTYNADGTTTITDALGNETTHAYDDRLTLVKDQNGAGGTTDKTYDHNFRPNTITDAGGDTTTLIWSANGTNLDKVVDAIGGQTDITYDALNNPTSVNDPLNYLTTYEYSGTLLTSVTDAVNGETVYTYTPEGYLESITDPLGNITSYTYDSFGQRTSMTDALGNIWNYEYDSLGRLVDTTDPLGRISRSEYDAAGRLSRSTRNYDANRPQNDENLWNIITEYQYDASGNQTAVIDTFGRTTQYQYDAAGRLVKTIDPQGNESTNTYNMAGQLVSTADALGRITQFAYDAAGRLVSTTDALGNATSTMYNLDGTVASTTDALGRTTSYTYDDLKRVIDVTQPNGGITHNGYDAAGNLTSTTDVLENVTYYEYDALGRLIKTTDPLGNFTETFYDSAGRMVQTKDARGNATTYAYDTNGRQISITDDLGNITSYEYDDLGRRVAVIDAADTRTEYTYDALDRVVTVTDPLGNEIHTVYDALGQVISRTDANGNDVSFEYDDLNRLVVQTDPMGNETSFTYNEVGNRLSVINPRGSVASTTYDELNRPVIMIDPLGNPSSTTYDAAGQVSVSTNAIGEETSFAYNSLGQQTSVTDPLGNVTQYSYDLAGRMTSMLDAKGTATAYEYDALGRMTAVIENYQAAVQATTEINVRTEYTYDENGNRLTIKDGNGHITNFTYDELNRLMTESDPLGNSWSYAYDALGNRISMTDANGNRTDYAYDDTNRLTGVDSIGTEADVSFSYDAGGRRTGMTDAIGTTSWSYDDLNRPTAIIDPFEKTVGYTYDAVGNRISLAYSGKEVNYVYDPANRLTEVSDQTRNTNYQYDPLGRLTEILRPNGVNSIYTYDEAGRLTQLQHGTLESELASYQYSYDAVGNRTQAVERVQTAGAGPTVRLTVVDSSGNLLSGKEVYAFNGDTYTGHHQTTNANGQVAITLPQGDYRFRTDVDGTQFWSADYNHCTIGQCSNLLVTIPTPVMIVVTDSDGNLRADVPVNAYSGGQYSGYHGVTNAEGALTLRLPAGDYTFRADLNGAQFWSQDTCVVSGCGIIPITVTLPVTVTVLDNINMPHAGIEVYAFNGTTNTGKHATTDENGQAQMTLLDGNYRFRADFNGTQFWSGAENHCTVPNCRDAGIVVTLPLVVTVTGTDGSPQQGISVYAFDGTTYSGFNGTTDVDGRVTFTLPAGNYRFRADLNGTQFWSDTQNHCAVPNCTGAIVTITSSTTITVTDTDNAPKAGVAVYAFNGATYTNYHGTTDTNGQVNLTLPQGSYRFRADYNGKQFWSGASNHCDIPGCSSASVTVTNGLLVTIQDTDGAPKVGLKVYAFNGTTYTGYNATTNTDGQVTFTLPQGSYRFRADLNGTQFWSGASNHCTLPGCASADVTITIPLTVTVQIADGTPQSGIKVYAFNGTTYTGYNATTNANGQVTLTLPLGNYRFRADYNGTQYWSGLVNQCAVPGCPGLTVIVGPQPTATATSSPTATPTQTGTPLPISSPVGTSTETPVPTSTATESPTPTEAPLGYQPENVFSVSFAQPRPFARKANAPLAQYDSFTMDEFDSASLDSAWTWVEPLAGPSWSLTNNPGFFQFTVPPDYEHWEGIDTAPTLRRTDMGDGDFAIETTFSFAEGSPSGGYQYGLIIGFSETDRLWMGVNENGSLNLNRTGVDSYEIGTSVLPVFLRIEKVGAEYTFLYKQNANDAWTNLAAYTASDPVTYVGMQGRTYAAESDVTYDIDYFRLERTAILVSNDVTITVLDTDNNPMEGLSVYTFDDITYTGFNGLTDENGQITFTLPDGSYRFRADLNGTQFWSGNANHCNVPVGCGQVNITVTKPVTVYIQNDSIEIGGLNIYAFDGDTYTGYHQVTNTYGEAVFTLPQGSYRFRADLNGTHFWSGSQNTCDVLDCIDDYINVSSPVTVTVLDTDETAMEGLNVYAFDGTTYTGYHQVTNAYGDAAFTLPYGNYRFRADLNGTQFWSGPENHCDLNTICDSVYLTVTKPVTIDVLDELNAPYPDLSVYAFDGDIYTGYHGVTDVNGQVILTLPQGNYHFRADLRGTQFWNNTLNDCPIPGCESATVTIPGGFTHDATTIDYTYDSLYRLNEANYSSGDYYHYAYDSVGNRLNQESTVNGLLSTVNYNYDIVNRLTDVDGVPYVYDANGNLLNDGANEYTYDPANRLSSATSVQSAVTSYQYNGLGDRLSQTVDGVPTNYTLDLNTGLTQVLSDGTNTYTYGLGRISQQRGGTPEYFLGDALGSVRQMTDQTGAITYTQMYDPYGMVTATSGTSQTDYGFTGESYGDSTQLLYLRSRFYNPGDGRFVSRDTFDGNYNSSQSFNRWNYTQSNPINHTDPSGLCVFPLCVFGPANLVVAQAKGAYGKVGPTLFALSQRNPWNNRFNCLDPRWSKPDKAIDLVADYFCERGPDLVTFSGKDALTLELSKSILFDGEIRQQFYRSKMESISGEMHFNIPEVLVALLDAINPSTGEISFPLTHFLGSFDYKVTRSASGRVEYQISNRTDLSSGTHLPMRYPPEIERNDPYSLEKFIEEYPLLASMEASYLIAGNPRIVSILAMKTRSETGFLQGGGTMFQTFKWSERYLGCEFENLPWIVRLTMLDVR